MDGSAAALADNPVKARPVKAHPRPSRVEFLAALRGAALIYIVFDHVVDEVNLRAGISSPAWQFFHGIYAPIDQITTGTRLVPLVFLTGLFLDRSIARGQRRFILTRGASLLWPLLLWGLIQGALYSAADWVPPFHHAVTLAGFADLRDALMSLNPALVIRGWWRISAQLWFLDMLAFFLILFLVLRRLPRALVLAGAAIWFIASFLATQPDDGAHYTPIVFIFGSYFLAFWLGIMMSDWAVRREARLTPAQAWLCLALFLGVSVPPALLGLANWKAYACLSGLAAIPLLLNGAKLLLATPLKPLFMWSGGSSLLILCTHMLFVVVLLVACRAVGLGPLLTYGLTATGALAGCYLLDQALQRLGWSAAVGFRIAA